MRDQKERRVVRRHGLLQIVRGEFTELPRAALMAGGVCALIAVFPLALWVEVAWGGTYRYDWWDALFSGAGVGAIVGFGIRMLGGSGPGAAANAIALSLPSAVTGLVLGTMWRVGKQDWFGAMFEPIFARPFLLLIGAAVGATVLIPDLGRNRDAT